MGKGGNVILVKHLPSDCITHVGCCALGGVGECNVESSQTSKVKVLGVPRLSISR